MKQLDYKKSNNDELIIEQQKQIPFKVIVACILISCCAVFWVTSDFDYSVSTHTVVDFDLTEFNAQEEQIKVDLSKDNIEIDIKKPHKKNIEHLEKKENKTIILKYNEEKINSNPSGPNKLKSILRTEAIANLKKSNNNAKPIDIDWLHVPKTGTSFLYSLVIYKCDPLLAKRFPADKEKEETKQMKRMSLAIRAGDSTLACTGGLRYHHKGLKKSEFSGHKNDAVGNVVSIFRDPISRAESAFVNDLHDCNEKLGDGLTSKTMCSMLADPNLPDETRALVEKRIMRFANCISGCAGRMITGSGCAHRGGSMANDNIENRIIQAKKKIDKFGFVGLTDRWSESMCLFRKKFPRLSGRSYPVDVTNSNVRPTKSLKCEDFIKDVLVKHNFTDSLDQAVYDHSLVRFEKELDIFPECKE